MAVQRQVIKEQVGVRQYRDCHGRVLAGQQEQGGVVPNADDSGPYKKKAFNKETQCLCSMNRQKNTTIEDPRGIRDLTKNNELTREQRK